VNLKTQGRSSNRKNRSISSLYTILTPLRVYLKGISVSEKLILLKEDNSFQMNAEMFQRSNTINKYSLREYNLRVIKNNFYKLYFITDISRNK